MCKNKKEWFKKTLRGCRQQLLGKRLQICHDENPRTQGPARAIPKSTSRNRAGALSATPAAKQWTRLKCDKMHQIISTIMGEYKMPWPDQIPNVAIKAALNKNLNWCATCMQSCREQGTFPKVCKSKARLNLDGIRTVVSLCKMLYKANDGNEARRNTGSLSN